MKLAILGTVGVPGRYGGFETLAENLVRFHHEQENPTKLSVYCSRRAYPDMPATFLSAHLRYSRFNANGVQSILYDAITLFDAVRRGNDQILLLGVSGAIALPFIRLFSRAKIVTNIDGIEWKRDKWRLLASGFLRWSERLAVRYSHVVIADNQGIADYVRQTYNVEATLIAYGGDHAIDVPPPNTKTKPNDLPDSFSLSLCRIEPENNVGMILHAFSKTGQPLVFVGNWENSDYGRDLRAQYSGFDNLYLVDPIYEPSALWHVRSRASAYVHGHSAGGTNPSLVEMMFFCVPIHAFDCAFNRFTTDNEAIFFATSEQLAHTLTVQPDDRNLESGARLYELAQRIYTWQKISQRYFDLLQPPGPSRSKKCRT